MHPALSVIIFTTLSGAGYGLLCWLGLYAALQLLPNSRVFGIVAMFVALGLVTVGLLSSTFHLGHPERSWRAFSQWRTSWLSREGVVSVFTYFPAIVFGAGWIFFERTNGLWVYSALLTSICAILTVICTAYIYRSLKPIPRWHNGWVVPNYLALSAMTGALLLVALSTVFGFRLPNANLLVLLTIIVAMLAKLGYWRFIDTDLAISTPESATGLGSLGKVSLFEAPHTSKNYLLKEMGFRIARKHVRKLRMIAVGLGFVMPFLLSAIACMASGAIEAICALFALASAMLGVFTERWLFFAEAKHTVTLYYGRSMDAT